MKLEACRQRDANSMQLAHIDPRTLQVYKIMSRLSIVCALALLVASSWVAAQAAAVHKWVDDKGVIHYSDAAPEASETSVVQLEISTGNRSSSAVSESSDHYYSIASQWQRIQQERLQQQQLELQKAALTVTRTTDQGRTDYDDEERTTRYVVAYPAKLHRRHGYRKRHPRHHRSYTHTRQSNPQPASLGSFPTTN
jgi:hypothetical protein